MRPLPYLGALLCAAASLVRANTRTASIYIQPVVPASSSSPPPPTLLAEIQYDTEIPAASEVSAYEAPELPEGEDSLVRIGLFDPKTGAWASSTSVAAAGNFARGYSPHFVLTVDAEGRYVGAAVRGVRVDAGATRDFGPQARVVVAGRGKQPELNRPVVLSPEGRKVPPAEEKTFLQKCVSAPDEDEEEKGREEDRLMLTRQQVLVASWDRCRDAPDGRCWRSGKIGSSFLARFPVFRSMRSTYLYTWFSVSKFLSV